MSSNFTKIDKLMCFEKEKKEKEQSLRPHK